MKLPSHSIILVNLVIILLFCEIEVSVATGQYSRFNYTSFQGGVICTPAIMPVRPTNLKEIGKIVTAALQSNLTVKALGSRHSASDVICTNGIPVDMHKINHFRYDASTKVATVGAGATLGVFLQRLHKVGRTLHGIPTYQGITIGGAMGTGSHGSNLRHPTTLADQVVGVVVVDGLGNIRNITDSEMLRAFRTHLGLLGIVYEISVATIPQHKMHIQHYPQPDHILFRNNAKEIIRLAESNDRFQFFWSPTSERIVLSVGNMVPVSSKGNCQTHFLSEVSYQMSKLLSEAYETIQAYGYELGYFVHEQYVLTSLYRNAIGKTPLFASPDETCSCEPASAVGYNHRMLANKCKECSWQHGNASIRIFEYSAIIPLTELPSAVNNIKKILSIQPAQFPLTGIYFRFLSPSYGLLTMNSGRASVSIEWVFISRKDRFNKPMMGLPASQAIMQALITKHGGRAHWGKNGPLCTQKHFLEKSFPNLPAFIQQMKEFDPYEVFMNEFGRRIKYGSRETSLDAYAKHCGLVDGCICENDRDCGDEGPDSYICDSIHNYSVCKERVEMYSTYRNWAVRKFVFMIVFLLENLITMLLTLLLFLLIFIFERKRLKASVFYFEFTEETLLK